MSTEHNYSKINIVNRLRGLYPIGPHLPNGLPEFGIRQFQATPIDKEAADLIEQLYYHLEKLIENVDLETEIADYHSVVDTIEFLKNIEVTDGRST